MVCCDWFLLLNGTRALSQGGPTATVVRQPEMIRGRGEFKCTWESAHTGCLTIYWKLNGSDLQRGQGYNSSSNDEHCLVYLTYYVWTNAEVKCLMVTIDSNTSNCSSEAVTIIPVSQDSWRPNSSEELVDDVMGLETTWPGGDLNDAEKNSTMDDTDMTTTGPTRVQEENRKSNLIFCCHKKSRCYFNRRDRSQGSEAPRTNHSEQKREQESATDESLQVEAEPTEEPTEAGVQETDDQSVPMFEDPEDQTSTTTGDLRAENNKKKEYFGAYRSNGLINIFGIFLLLSNINHARACPLAVIDLSLDHLQPSYGQRLNITCSLQLDSCDQIIWFLNDKNLSADHGYISRVHDCVGTISFNRTHEFGEIRCVMKGMQNGVKKSCNGSIPLPGVATEGIASILSICASILSIGGALIVAGVRCYRYWKQYVCRKISRDNKEIQDCFKTKKSLSHPVQGPGDVEAGENNQPVGKESNRRNDYGEEVSLNRDGKSSISVAKGRRSTGIDEGEPASNNKTSAEVCLDMEGEDLLHPEPKPFLCSTNR